MMRGTSVMSAIPVQSVAEEYAHLQQMLGAGTYAIESQALVERGGRWYDAITVQLYDGTPVVFYFDISAIFPPFGTGPRLPGVRTALSGWGARFIPPSIRPRFIPPSIRPRRRRRRMHAYGQSESSSAPSPGAWALLLGAGLLAAGAVMTRKEAR